MKSTSAQVSVIIVSYNNAEVLGTALYALQSKIFSPPIEIIVVDNASNGPNVKLVRREFPGVCLIVNSSNVGFAQGCNVGAHNASCDYLLFMNSDIILQDNPLPEMLALLEQNVNIGIVGCQLLNRDGTLQPSYYRFPGLLMRFFQLSGLKAIILRLLPHIRFQRASVFTIDFVSGAFLMISRELFFEIGGFDRRYFMYLEDADLCHQARRKGKAACVLSNCHITHLGHHCETLSNPFVFRHFNIGQIRFYKKNYKRPKLYVLAIMSVVLFSIRLLASFLSGRGVDERNELRNVIRLYGQLLVPKWQSVN